MGHRGESYGGPGTSGHGSTEPELRTVEFLDAPDLEGADEDLREPTGTAWWRRGSVLAGGALLLVVLAVLARTVTRDAHRDAVSHGRSVPGVGGTVAGPPPSDAPEGNRASRTRAAQGGTMTIVVGGQAETVSTDGHGGLSMISEPSYAALPGCPAHSQCAVVHQLSAAAAGALRTALPGVVVDGSTSLLWLRAGRFGPDLASRTIRAHWRGAAVLIQIHQPRSSSGGGWVRNQDGNQGRGVSGIWYGPAFQVQASITSLPVSRQLTSDQLYTLMTDTDLVVAQ